MSAASEKKLNELHCLVAEEFAKAIKAGAYSPALLNAARQFLRDNNISAARGEDNPALDKLADALPFMKANDEDGMPFSDKR